MSNDNNSLAHATWNCKYHIVLAVKTALSSSQRIGVFERDV